MYPSMYLSIYLTSYPYLYQSIYISIYLPIHLYLSIYPSISIYLYLSVSLSLCIYIYIYSSLYDRVVDLEKSKLTILLCVRRVASQLTLDGAKVSIHASICKYMYLSISYIYESIYVSIYLSN